MDNDRTQASSSLVDRYLPMVYSVIAKYRLDDEDSPDVKQTAWLYLVPNIGCNSAVTDGLPRDDVGLPIARCHALRDGSA